MDHSKPPRDHEAFPDGRCRLILIGKTGCGKSATGNTILGRNKFLAQVGINSQTETCDLGSTKREGLLISVMDTPGLADTKGRDGVIAELITRSLLAVHPGPHAVILCIRCDDRFTETEYNVYLALKEIFGDKMTSYLIVVFVGVDQLESRGVCFEDMLKDKRCEKLKSLLQEADNRYLLFNNNADDAKKYRQVSQLLLQVKKVVVQNGGECFKHKVSSEIGVTMERLVEEEIRINEVVETAQEGEEAEMEAQGRQQDIERLRQAGTVKARLRKFGDGQQGAEKEPPPVPRKAMINPYTVPDRPGINMEQKQEMVDRVLTKVVRDPSKLNAAQRENLDKTSISVGRKIKDGMAKFAVKAIDQCSLM